MSVLKITWSAFGGDASVEFMIFNAEHIADLDMCERLFAQTNRYEGDMWDSMEKYLPENRTHTALSIGDMISIDERTYRCEEIGWSKIELAPTEN